MPLGLAIDGRLHTRLHRVTKPRQGIVLRQEAQLRPTLAPAPLRQQCRSCSPALRAVIVNPAASNSRMWTSNASCSLRPTAGKSHTPRLIQIITFSTSLTTALAACNDSPSAGLPPSKAGCAGACVAVMAAAATVPPAPTKNLPRKPERVVPGSNHWGDGGPRCGWKSNCLGIQSALALLNVQAQGRGTGKRSSPAVRLTGAQC